MRENVWSRKHISTFAVPPCLCTCFALFLECCLPSPSSDYLYHFILQDSFRYHWVSIQGLVQCIAYRNCSINACGTEQSRVWNLWVLAHGPESHIAVVNSGSPQLSTGSTVPLPQAPDLSYKQEIIILLHGVISMTSELTSVKAIHNHRNIAVDPLMARIMIYSFNLGWPLLRYYKRFWLALSMWQALLYTLYTY